MKSTDRATINNIHRHLTCLHVADTKLQHKTGYLHFLMTVLQISILDVILEHIDVVVTCNGTDCGFSFIILFSLYIIMASLSKPHIINVKFIRSVCLSVCTFMTQKYTRVVLIYGYLQLLIAVFTATASLNLKFNVYVLCVPYYLQYLADISPGF